MTRENSCKNRTESCKIIKNLFCRIILCLKLLFCIPLSVVHIDLVPKVIKTENEDLTRNEDKGMKQSSKSLITNNDFNQENNDNECFETIKKDKELSQNVMEDDVNRELHDRNWPEEINNIDLIKSKDLMNTDTLKCCTKNNKNRKSSHSKSASSTLKGFFSKLNKRKYKNRLSKCSNDSNKESNKKMSDREIITGEIKKLVLKRKRRKIRKISRDISRNDKKLNGVSCNNDVCDCCNNPYCSVKLNQ